MNNRYKFIDENKEHLHTLDGQPLKGNTTILQVISKNLTWWAAELAAVECLETGEKIETIREEYLNACKGNKKEGIDKLQEKYPIFKKARFAHFETRNKKADDGTDMHEALELYTKYCIENNNGVPQKFPKYKFKQVEIFSDWAEKNVKRFILSETHCYSEKLWTGAIADLIYEDKDDKLAIMDFKSSKEVFMSQFLQNAGIDIMASENGFMDKDGNEIYKLEKPIGYYGIFPFGAKEIEPKFYYDVDYAKQVYEAVVLLDKFINLK